MNIRAMVVTLVTTGIVVVPSIRSWAAMDLNGAISTDNYLGLRDGEFYDFKNANAFRLKVQAKPSDSVAAHVDIQLRNTNFTAVKILDQLWDRGSLDPVSWRIDEAYTDLYGLFFNSDDLVLDVRAGKQVLGWGEGDGFNPSNPFDPFDLENPLEFDHRLGNVSLKATLTIGEELFSIEGVFLPRFLPSVLPVALFLGEQPLDSPLMPGFDPDQFASQAGLDVLVRQPGNDVLRTITPDPRVDNVTGGARIKWAMIGLDWAISYAWARETIPVPATAGLNASLSAADSGLCPNAGSGCLVVDFADVQLVYPRIQVLGLNFRGGLGDVGVWGEAAVVFPETLTASVTTEIPAVGKQQDDLVVLDGEVYTKWVLGAEYTFQGGFYFNLQWVHGFFTEMTGHGLHDYLFGVFRQAWMSDKIKMEINLGGELNHSHDQEEWACLVGAKLGYRPFDGAWIEAGAIMARGEDGTSLELFERLDQVFLKFNTEF